jgi:glycosyltransferase involved in cell wall biosynthesis
MFPLPLSTTMLGVLHLYPARCDFQTERSVETLSKVSHNGISKAAMSIGPGGDFTNLPQAILAMRSNRGPKANTIHAWGPAELIAAAASSASRIIFSPQCPVNRSWLPWIKFVLRRRRIELVFPSATLRDSFIERGITSDDCQVIYPGVDLDRLGEPDAGLRVDLGLAESDLVLLAPGESTSQAAHRSSIWSTAILHFLDERYRLLVWGRGPSVESLSRFARSGRHERVLVQAERQLQRAIDFEQIIPSADAAIVSAEGLAPTLPLFICMAAGLPVVAARTPATDEFLKDTVTALIEPTSTPRRLAQRVLDLQSDASLKRDIAEAARAEAREKYSEVRFVENWHQLYGRFDSDDSRATARASAS